MAVYGILEQIFVTSHQAAELLLNLLQHNHHQADHHCLLQEVNSAHQASSGTLLKVHASLLQVALINPNLALIQVDHHSQDLISNVHKVNIQNSKMVNNLALQTSLAELIQADHPAHNINRSQAPNVNRENISISGKINA